MLLNIKTICRALNLLILPVVLMILFTACGEDTPTTPDPDPQPELNLAEVLSEESDYSTLVSLVSDDLLNALQNDGFETLLSAIESTGLTTTLQFLDPFTTFAPTDTAFANLPDGLLASLTAEQLTEILLYHVIEDNIESGDIPAGETTIQTVNG